MDKIIPATILQSLEFLRGIPVSDFIPTLLVLAGTHVTPCFADLANTRFDCGVVRPSSAEPPLASLNSIEDRKLHIFAHS